MSVKKLKGLSTGNKTTVPQATATPEPDIRWKAASALRTIHEAAEHQKDKGLMKAVKKMAKEQAKACGIK